MEDAIGAPRFLQGFGNARSASSSQRPTEWTPPEAATDDKDVDLHIAESRDGSAALPSCIKGSFDPRSLLHRYRNSLLRCPRWRPTDPRPPPTPNLRGPPGGGPLRRLIAPSSWQRGFWGWNECVNRSNPRGYIHEALPAVTFDGGRGHRAVRVAHRHVGRGDQLRLARGLGRRKERRLRRRLAVAGRGQAGRDQPL